MGSKKTRILLITLLCSFALLALIVTVTVPIVLNNVQKARDQRVETCLKELSEEFAPDVGGSALGASMKMYSYRDFGKDENAFEIYEEISDADVLAELDVYFSSEQGEPFLYALLKRNSEDPSSLYLYNGNVYTCAYEYDFGSYDIKIDGITDAEEVFGDFDWSKFENIDWNGPNLLNSEDIDKLSGMLGISDFEGSDIIGKLSEDPESVFVDAAKELKDGQTMFVFDLDADCFGSYFEALEKQIVLNYVADFGARTAYVCVVPQEDELRVSLALADEIYLSGAKSSLKTVIDVVLDTKAAKPYILDDVIVADEYSIENAEVSNIDYGNTPMSKPDDEFPEDPSLCEYFVMDMSTAEFKNVPLNLGNGLFACHNGDKIYIYTVEGNKVRTLDFRYEITEVLSDGDYMTVLLGMPEVDIGLTYLFKNAKGIKCITYDVNDFSCISSVELDGDITESTYCFYSGSLVLQNEKGCWFVDVSDGTCVQTADIRGLHDYRYYDVASDKLWLYDIYLGGIVVDLNDYTYMFTDDLPKEENYVPSEAKVEGYSYIKCFAEWKSYELAWATSADNTERYLAIYDKTTQSIVGEMQVKSFSGYNIVTDNDEFVYMYGNVMGVVDLTSLLG